MKRLILHLGHPKTATTFLQSVMHLNEEAFCRQGFWIPSDFAAFGSYDFHSLAADGHIFSGNLQAMFEAATIQDSDRLGRMMDYALHSNATNVILSSELLFYYNWVVQEIVQRANQQDFQVEILVYLARQDKAVVTGYLQSIRNHGTHGSVVQYLEEHRKELLFDYAAVIDSYGVVLPNRVTVRTFDPAFLHDGSICSDFLNFLQCSINPTELCYPRSDLNTRLPLEWCEVLRACNSTADIQRIERLRGAAPKLDDADRQRTEAYYYREDVRDYALAHYMAGNRELVSNYLLGRSEAEKRYWLELPPVETNVQLNSRRLDDCMRHLYSHGTSQ